MLHLDNHYVLTYNKDNKKEIPELLTEYGQLYAKVYNNEPDKINNKMYVLIKGRKFKVYGEKGKFYVQKRKTYKKYIKAKDVVMSPYPSQKRKQIPADISRILEEDKVLRSRMKSLDAILAQKEKQISELKSEFNEAEIKQFIKDCVDAKELLNRDIQNLRGENIQNLLTVVNVWVSAGFIPLDRKSVV